MHYYYYYFPIKTCFVRVDLLFGELLIMIEFIIRVVIVVPLTTGSCTNKKKKKMPLEVDNDGYHSLTEMFSIIHLFFMFGKKNFQIIYLYQTNNKRQHFFVENMLEMWKQNAIRKVALTFRLLPYHNILNLELHTYIYWS